MRRLQEQTELKLESADCIVVAAFYKFVSLPNYAELKDPIKDFLLANQIKGTVLLASEGINSTISGTREGINKVLSFFKGFEYFADLEHKESYFAQQPFQRTKVKLKKEIVSLGKTLNSEQKLGVYVAPKAWNELIQDPEVVVLDTRNDYEVQMGSFQKAINPQTNKFRDLPKFVRNKLAQYKNKKIAMFCTGGIRCEKFSAYMLEEGFQEVYQLHGGILKYLEEVPKEESLWQGSCFVFDERVGVKHGLEPISENDLSLSL
jgi:UPF0176 protein